MFSLEIHYYSHVGCQVTLANPVFTADFTQFQKIPKYIASINKPNLENVVMCFFVE